MKLILCPHCHDVIKLAKTVRFCECKKSGGQYKGEEFIAFVIPHNCPTMKRLGE